MKKRIPCSWRAEPWRLGLDSRPETWPAAARQVHLEHAPNSSGLDLSAEGRWELGMNDEPCSFKEHLEISSSSWRYPNSWLVYKGTSYWNGWFGGTPISGNHHLPASVGKSACISLDNDWNECEVRISIPALGFNMNPVSGEGIWWDISNHLQKSTAK